MFGTRTRQRKWIGARAGAACTPRVLLCFALAAVAVADASAQEVPPPDCVPAGASAVAAAPPHCTAAALPPATTAPVLAQSGWLAPLGSGPRGPAAGSLLAGICLAWLALLLIATVVRPRGWHHKPLFPGLRRKS